MGDRIPFGQVSLAVLQIKSPVLFTKDFAGKIYRGRYMILRMEEDSSEKQIYFSYPIMEFDLHLR